MKYLKLYIAIVLTALLALSIWLIIQEKTEDFFGGTVSQREKLNLMTDFDRYYKHNVNDNISNNPIDINLRNFMAKFHVHTFSQLASWQSEVNSGIYMYFANVDNSFSYIFSATKYSSSATSIIGFSPAQINNTDQNESDHFSQTNAYFSGIKINDFSPFHFHKHVSQIQCNEEPVHPRRCFFDYQVLYYFLIHNKDSLRDANDSFKANAQIRIENGATSLNFTDEECHSELNGLYKFQTPILTFRVNGHLLLNDNMDYQMPFKNKALDIGKLCPPECN